DNSSNCASLRRCHLSQRRLVLYPPSVTLSLVMLSSRVARASLRASARRVAPIPQNAGLNGLRTYATAAQDTKPPLAMFGIDGTYANALVCILLPCSRHWRGIWNRDPDKFFICSVH